VRRARVRAGRFHTWFAPAYAASYRVYVVARADAKTARGRSPLRVVEVTAR
jgi:hypothetical protein